MIRLWVLVFVLAVGAPRLASSATGEHRISLSSLVTGHLEQSGDLGGGLQIEYGYGLADWINVELRFTQSWLVDGAESGDVRPLFTGQFGVTFHLDALTWVPYLSLTASAGAVGEGEQYFPGYGGQLGFGVDYRAWRHWAIGGWTGFQLMLGDRWFHTWTCGIRLSLYLR